MPVISGWLLRVMVASFAWATAAQPMHGASGSIEGVILVPPKPVRRVAERYASATSAPERPVQSVPALVYLEGENLPAPTPGRFRIAQHDTAFVPAALVVPVGATVDFPNEDPFFHNVFSYSKPKRFDLGRYPRGESKAVHFDSPGIVKIYCEVHKSMRSVVAVVKSSFYAVADAEGRFSIADVPEGSYRLVVVVPDRGNKTMVVNVRAGETTVVKVPFS